MLPKPDTSEHFPPPHLSHSLTIQCHWWQQPSIRLKRKVSEPISSLMAEWAKSQNVPIFVPPTNHWKAQPEARFPEEKTPPWEINAHVKSVSTKLFSVGASVPHNQSCIWGIATPFYGAHVKNFFFFSKIQTGKCRFPRNDSKLSLCIQENGAMRTQALSPRRGAKVKSISMMMSICSIKIDNIGFWGGLFEK